MIRGVLTISVCCLTGLLTLPGYAQSQRSSDGPRARPAQHEGAAPAPATPFVLPAGLAGTWRSRPEEITLSGDFDRQVWGPDAKSVRTVELTLESSGSGTIRVTRRVLNARGVVIRGSSAIEEAQFALAGPGETVGTRVPFETKITKAERRYPDTPNERWPVDGFRLKLVPFDGDTSRLEVRWDTPEGPGSFWETLRRAPARRATT